MICHIQKEIKKLIFLEIFLFTILIFSNTKLVFASEVNGTIDSSYKYAWGENIGWLNFGCDNCNVSITDNAISGNAWSKQYGWINLNPPTSGVYNTQEGVLSGYAWSSNLGWINFSGVTIDLNGNFSGYATIKSDNSRINFDCSVPVDSCNVADFKLKTDWRPLSVRHSGVTNGSYPIKKIIEPTIPVPEITTPSILSRTIDYILNLLKSKEKSTVISVATEIPKVTPEPFKTKWNLLPVKEIKRFVFAPLPYEIRIIASKFLGLDKTLKSVGVNRFSDIDKLTGVTFNIKGLSELEKTIKNISSGELANNSKLTGIPSLSNINGKMVGNISTGKIALLKGLPVSKFPLIAKNNLPTEFVFARAGGELVDLNVALSIGNKGEVTQKIASLPGKTLRLVVKPISKAKNVTGYFVFKSATPKVSTNEIYRESMTATALFAVKGLVEKIQDPVPIEKKLVLSTFEYLDEDHDGIYTADVITPVVTGEYEVITVIDYIDPVLGIRKMSMVTVIDPEGYVFEKNNGKETRIPSAIVSLYQLNTSTKKYELWPAKDYQQENPQITDIRGTYSFLVPEGSYYFEVEAPGYDIYQGKVFVVSEGGGVHMNIELKSGLKIFSSVDWKDILLIVVILLLVYNLFRDKLSNIFKRV